MSEQFDPYHKWLGIPPHAQPADYYRLFGLRTFESDPDVIANAADRVMAHVKTFQTGRFAQVSQQLLNELSVARGCLEVAEKKAEYDASLRSKMNSAAVASLPPATNPGSVQQAALPNRVVTRPPAPVVQTAAVSTPKPIVPVPSQTDWRSQYLRGKPAIVGGIVVAMIFLIGMLFGAALFRSSRQTVGDDLPNGELATQASSNPDAKPPPSPKQKTDRKEPIQLNPPPGVTAEKLVIWNQYNGRHNDRGATACRVHLYRGDRIVWSSDELEIAWNADTDENLSVDLPEHLFDRARVEVTGWHKNGGGLAEIEVVSDGRNIAHGQPARASSWFGFNYRPSRVTDGITTSSKDDSGFWLLPDKTGGWVEVDLSLPAPQQVAVTASKVVLRNAHNAHHNNTGTKVFNLILKRNSEEVWSETDVEFPWEADRDSVLAINLPKTPFDVLKVDVTGPAEHAGLSEIEIYSNGENIALGCPANAMTSHNRYVRGSRVVDGIKTSNRHQNGYWIGAKEAPNWVEVDLRCTDEQVGAANRQVGEYYCFGKQDWQRGLQWLARADDPQLRLLAKKDLEFTTNATEQITIADGWWELALKSSGIRQKSLKLRALRHYAKAIPRTGTLSRLRIERRLQQAIPEFDEKDSLFFQSIVAISGTAGGHLLRDKQIIVDDVPYNYGLWVHPTDKKSSRVAFRLNKKFRQLVGAVAINDSAGMNSRTPLMFRVVGDSQTLWTSGQVQAKYVEEDFNVDISGIDLLELFVDCPGDSAYAHAVWLDPSLQR